MQINREKMVAIANDVLIRLNTNELKARMGVYIGTDGMLKGASSIRSLILGEFEGESSFKQTFGFTFNETIQSIFGDNGPKYQQCHVCAVGALFMADALTSNEITVGEAVSPWRHLQKYTTMEQLALLDTAFEGCDVGLLNDFVGRYENGELVSWYMINTDIELSAELVDLAKDYFSTEMAGVRLRILMRNIIKNNGEFNPRTTAYELKNS